MPFIFKCSLGAEHQLATRRAAGPDALRGLVIASRAKGTKNAAVKIDVDDKVKCPLTERVAFDVRPMILWLHGFSTADILRIAALNEAFTGLRPPV